MFTFLLYQTENPENLGSIARAASNFNFHEILLLDPKCAVESKSRWLAKHGLPTLEKMRVIPAEQVQATLDSFDIIVATQGRNSTAHNLVRAPITPRQLRERLETADPSTRVGVLFGPEGEGLSIPMLKDADIILAIPTSRDNPSMNLAMSVAVVLYELSLLRGHENKITLPYRSMNAKERDALLALIDQTLDAMKFKNEKQKETQRIVWRHMIGRSFLTKKEYAAIMGYLKSVLHLKGVDTRTRLEQRKNT